MIRWEKDHFGRHYLNIGRGFFCVGFGPVAFIERVWWRGELVYYDHEAMREGQRRRKALGLDQG